MLQSVWLLKSRDVSISFNFLIIDMSTVRKVRIDFLVILMSGAVK